MQLSTKRSSINTPNPSPSRGAYGFVLFIFSILLFFLYLFWALVPSYYLKALHLQFLPSKYWAVAVPLLIPVLIFLFVSFQFTYNLIQFKSIFKNVDTLENDFIDPDPVPKIVALDSEDDQDKGEHQRVDKRKDGESEKKTRARRKKK